MKIAPLSRIAMEDFPMMLDTPLPQALRDRGNSNAGASTVTYDWRWMIGAVLDRRRVVVWLTLGLVTLAVAFVLLRPASYTATAALELTNLRLQFSPGPENGFFGDRTVSDPNFHDTQIQILGSDRIALGVAKSLKLVSPDAQSDEKEELLRIFRRNFSIERRGLSNIIWLSYSAPNPEKAARIVNEFARVYIADQDAARNEAAQSATGWLRDKLREIGPKARVVATALPPIYKSGPRRAFIVAGAGVLGVLLGIATALVLAFIDRRIWTPEQAVAAARAQCFGMVPDLSKKAHATDTEADPNLGIDRQLIITDPVLRAALDNPLSDAGLTLRHAKAACDDCFGGKGLRYLGITSIFSGEGRSTVAANMALSVAASGNRVLLVDCDAYNPKLSRDYASGSRTGLVDYVSATSPTLSDHILVEPRTHLHFLPFGGEGQIELGAQLWSDGMKRLFDETTSKYDYVIFDMPPVAMAGDVRASARFIQGYLLVVGWGKATSDEVHVGLRAVGSVLDRLLGTVLNKVNAAKAPSMVSPEFAFYRHRAKTVGEQSALAPMRIDRPSQGRRLVLVGAAAALVITVLFASQGSLSLWIEQLSNWTVNHWK